MKPTLKEVKEAAKKEFGKQKIGGTGCDSNTYYYYINDDELIKFIYNLMSK